MNSLTQTQHRELAKDICNLGIGTQGLPISTGEYILEGKRMSAPQFNTDAYVMAAVMKLCFCKEIILANVMDEAMRNIYESLNLAVTTAGVAALTGYGRG